MTSAIDNPGGLTVQEINERVASVRRWHHIMELADGVTTPGAYNPGSLLARLDLPEDMSGMRVLDVGTRDGYFAFLCEKRGATVVAIDSYPADEMGFAVAKEILGSKVEFAVANVYDLSPEVLGTFDLVLFLGVLYHLRHPLLALDRLRSVATGQIYVETLACDNSFFVGHKDSRAISDIAPAIAELPFAQFLPYGQFHDDWTNKWSPNLAGLRALVEDAGFEVDSADLVRDRAIVRAHAVEDAAMELRRSQDLQGSQ